MTSRARGFDDVRRDDAPHVVLCDPPVTFARAEAPDDPSGAGSSGAPSKSLFRRSQRLGHRARGGGRRRDDDGVASMPPAAAAGPGASRVGRRRRVPPRPVSIRVPPGPALDARVSPQWKPGLDRRDFRSAPLLVAIKRSDVAIDVYRVDVVVDDGVAARGAETVVVGAVRAAPRGETILSFLVARAAASTSSWSPPADWSSTR